MTLLPPDFIASVCFCLFCLLLFLLVNVMFSLLVKILSVLCSCYCNAVILRIEAVHSTLDNKLIILTLIYINKHTNTNLSNNR